MSAPDFSDALFVLDCDCILVGCSNSDPGLKWRGGVRNGRLYCTKHAAWVLLVDAVTARDSPETTDV